MMLAVTAMTEWSFKPDHSQAFEYSLSSIQKIDKQIALLEEQIKDLRTLKVWREAKIFEDLKFKKL